MATLTNTKIKDTYVGLLKTSDNEAIDAAGVTLLEDGVGNASALSVGRSSNGVTITGTATATAFAGNLTGNVSGNVTGNLTGTVLTAAQANITSVGTLSGLTVSADALIHGLTVGRGGGNVSTNTALGNDALDNNTTGSLNAAFGRDALVNNTTGTRNIAIGFGAGDAIETGSNNTIIGDIAGTAGLSNTIILAAGTTERLRIDSSGNVGIGTSSPDATLHLKGDNSVSNLVLKFEDTRANTPPNHLYGQIQFYGSDTSEAGPGIKAAIRANSPGTNGEGYLTFSTSDTSANDQERVRIDSSGRVGIGTSSPAEKVHIEGHNSKLKITNTNTTATGFHGIIFESLDTVGFTTQSLGQIDFVTSAGATGLSARIKGEMTNISGAGSIVFSAGAAGAASEKARITANGLTFNGTSDALDDYEEGTWDAEYFPTTGSFATMTMDVPTAKYTKIGNMVTVYAVIRTDDVDVTGGSGTVRISGLPFTVTAGAGGMAIGSSENFTNAPDGGFFVTSTTQIALRKTGTSASLAVADLSNGTNANHNSLLFTATYLV